MILAALAKQLEQLVEQKGRGDHGRARVMPETTTLEHLGAAANGLQPVDKRHGIALRAHAKRRRDPAEAGADHKNVALAGGPGIGVRGRNIVNSRRGWCHNACVKPVGSKRQTSGIPAAEASV